MKKYNLRWRDAGRSVLITLLGALLMTIQQSGEGTFPSWEDFRLSLLVSLKGGVIPYLIINFFTDHEKAAEKTLIDAEVAKVKAAAPNDKELNP